MRVLAIGHDAVLATDLDADPAAWAAGVRALDHPGVVDVVPAAETVLVRCASPDHLTALVPRLEAVQAVGLGGGDRPIVEIPVVYDGADLDDCARLIGATTADVVRLHSGVVLDVAFCGFAPGFAYLRGLPDVLHLARLPTPRTSVPGGSVAVAAGFSAVYPRASPGGWRLIGRTDSVMFDPRRVPVALVEPGDRVRFVPR